ncbi:FAD-binding oxidoreductase [Pseudolysobacter antarcticus]|uniref:FAD-binding oxidoreductase n=1 Tax=Pseudolysobacter antarcticus TaxID=2511995 RepID=A0A411HQ01_9GAMM|nr:FAD-binding oxidoreductase [Pseudolysobacter antarcticus]
MVGAGIIGSACAEACAAGGLNTVLIDSDFPGGGITACGMGHIVVMDDSAAQWALTARSRELWMRRAASLPDDIEYDACGTLWIAANRAEMDAVEEKVAMYRQHDVHAQILNSAELARAEPDLISRLSGALLVRDDAVIYPPAAAQHFAANAATLGAVMRFGQRVQVIEPGRIYFVDGTMLDAERIVVAAGLASNDLLPNLPLRARKGHLVISDRYPGRVRHQLVELGYLHSAHASDADSVAFNVQPRRNGQILIGSSRQFDATDTAIDAPLLAHMLERAVGFLPFLRDVQVLRSWTGLRPATRDGLPLIGPSAQHASIWLATGHEGLGITTATATAELIAAQLLGRTCAIPPAPYWPTRFASETTHAVA